MNYPKNIFIGKKYSIRQEVNGITAYRRSEHTFSFYESLTIDDVTSAVPDLSVEGFERYIGDKAQLKTQNIQMEGPLYVGWQLSGACNLDCVYCFAEHTLSQDAGGNALETAESILRLNPMCVGLSGGEPTLNRHLPEIMKMLSGKVSYILNTNGTTRALQGLIPQLKEDGALVRISIDSTDNAIENRERPAKANRSLDYDQMSIIRESVRMLLDAEVPLVIHALVTRWNEGDLSRTAADLIDMGVKRLHLYRLDYSHKNADVYHELFVPSEEILAHHLRLQEEFGDRLLITSATSNSKGASDAKNSRERAILLVDCAGQFNLADASNNTIYVGEDPRNPTPQEIRNALNFEVHKRCYLDNFSLA